MARYQVEIRKEMAPFGNKIHVVDVVVANNGSGSMYACVSGRAGEETLFQFVQLLTDDEQRGSLMHIRNIGIYDMGLNLVITTSIYDVKHALIRIVLKNEHDGVLGIWNEDNMVQQAIQ